MDKVSKAFKKIKLKAKADEEVLAILSFGSYARGERYSDIDVCLILRPGNYDELHLSEKRLDYLTVLGEGFDVQIFQQLPLYIGMRVLKEGSIEFCKDESALYEFAFQTIKDFELFEPIYREYLEAVASAR